MSGATLARRHAGAWGVIARALSAEQLTGDARAAVHRLNHQVEAFAARHADGSLPAVLVEATPELIAEFGCVALHLGDDKFAFISLQGDQPAAPVDGDNSGESKLGRHELSVAHDQNRGATGLLTPRALRLLALLWLIALAAIVLAGCGGGGDDPDVMTPRVNCATEVCR